MNKANYRRSQLRTLREIMELMDTPIILTHIMYKGNLSYIQLKKYLKFLKQGQLITKVGTVYQLTANGFTFRSILRLGLRKDP